jgi:hypothetical protein
MGIVDAARRFRTGASTTVAADGTFTRNLTLGRNVQDKVNRVLPDADCATEAFGCLVSVGDGDGRGGLVPVSFDLHAPAPPAPVVGLAPITTPGDEHAVLAFVSGAPPDTDLSLQECEPGAVAPCDLERTGLGDLHTDASGRGAVVMPIYTSMMTQDGLTRCDLSPGACVVRLGDDNGDAFNTQTPIPFGAPTIVPGIGSVTEPTNGTTVLNVPVTLSALSFSPVTVSYATADATATAGLDYTATSGTITFAPLQTTATIPITVKSDTLDEPDEVVRVALSNPTGATLGGFYGLGFGVIVDANPPPVIVPGSTTTPEGGPGTHVVNVPVTLSAASGKTVSASWHTLDGSAVAGTDYQAASGTLTFPPGQTTTTIPVTIIGDAVHDQNKLMLVGITNPVNATVGGFYGLGAVTITDP